MIAIHGIASRLAQAVLPLLPESEEVIPVERGANRADADRHLFCRGLLRPATILAQTREEIAESFIANAAQTIAKCDTILAVNGTARICVIGSESGFSWSYDGAYAASKAALHRYVETKKLRTPWQQLVCIAPGIVEDAGMTLRRTDEKRLEERKQAHPKQRFLTCAEVARLIHYCLYVDQGYLTGQILRFNGGEHIR